MKKITNKQKVKDQLKQFGFVTNKWAIENGNWRLGATIKILRNEGWLISGDYIEGTKNWKYVLVESAKKKIYICDLGEDGVRRPREVMVPA